LTDLVASPSIVKVRPLCRLGEEGLVSFAERRVAAVSSAFVQLIEMSILLVVRLGSNLHLAAAALERSHPRCLTRVATGNEKAIPIQLQLFEDGFHGQQPNDATKGPNPESPDVSMTVDRFMSHAKNLLPRQSL
jgi:hypothetical protein